MTESSQDQPFRPRKRSGGCLMTFCLIGIVSLGYGTYLMTRWNELSGPAKSAAVVLVVIGAIAMIPLIVMIAVVLIVRRFLGRVSKELAGAGEQIMDLHKAMYGEIHEFRPAADRDYARIDLHYYDTTTSDLEAKGFQHLGDIVDTTAERILDASPVIRCFTSPDGTTGVAIYDFRDPNNTRSAGMKICDVSTEFSDQTHLITSNTSEADLMTPAIGLETRRHPLHTTIDQLLDLHAREKQKLLAGKGDGVTCVAIHTLDDAIASEKRQQQIKNTYRQNIGFVDPDEITRMAANVQRHKADAAAFGDDDDPPRREC